MTERGGHPAVAPHARCLTEGASQLMSESRATPLAAEHMQLGASFTDFAGWSMPVRYTSDIAEHTAVRTTAGLFDLSHMGELEVIGASAARALDHSLVGTP